MGQIHKFATIAAWALLLWLPLSHAQEDVSAKSNASQESEPQPPGDSLGRDTPRSSLEGFLVATDEGDFVKAAEYLDLRMLPRKYKSVPPTRLAQMLDVVIERGLWIDLEELSDDPKGEAGDDLPAYRDELGRIDDGDKEFILLMQRVPGDEGRKIWKVSNATVAKVADLYKEYGYGPAVEAFAKAIPDGRLLGVEYFKWVMMITAGLIAYPLLMLLGLGLARLISDSTSPLFPRVKRLFIGPVALLGMAQIMKAVMTDLGVGITAQRVLEAGTLNSIIVIWLLVSGIGLIRDAYARRLAQGGRDVAIVLLRPAAQVVRLLSVIVVILVWLDNIGFNITTLLAGLGVGGVAVALALQRPMEDVFGALSLYTQQPVRVGDFCRIGSETGTIEEIGLRSTRLRTLADTVISIPNAKLAGEAIDNISFRQKILYNPIIRLRMDTSREQLEKVLEGIRELLASHERIVKGNPRIRFQRIGEDALELGVFAYADTRTYADYLEVAEDLNMKILDIVSGAGTTLALPGQSLYMESSPG